MSPHNRKSPDIPGRFSPPQGPADTVLDFGAGRGEMLTDDTVSYRREICDLRARCGHLDGCDIDPVVLENPYQDEARVIEFGAPLPYEVR